MCARTSATPCVVANESVSQSIESTMAVLSSMPQQAMAAPDLLRALGRYDVRGGTQLPGHVVWHAVHCCDKLIVCDSAIAIKIQFAEHAVQVCARVQPPAGAE